MPIEPNHPYLDPLPEQADDREPCYRGCSEWECDCSRCVARDEHLDDGQEETARYEREDNIADEKWNQG
jgi:hypothetical protein